MTIRKLTLEEWFTRHQLRAIARRHVHLPIAMSVDVSATVRHYAALGAQVANTPEWGAELMDAHFDPVVLRLIDMLMKALPDCSKEDIFWGYHFVTGSLMLTLARTGRIDKLSGGLCKSDDFVAVKQRMVSFMTGGFLAICNKKA